MPITITKLSTGYYHVRGDGPCNWAQLPHWPATEQEIRKHAFPEASETFIREATREAVAVAENALGFPPST